MALGDLSGLMADAMKESTLMINKEGVGIFVWPDGRVYEGHWKDGKQHGYGRYYNQNNEEKYGFWNNGRRERWLNQDEFAKAQEQGFFDFLG